MEIITAATSQLSRQNIEFRKEAAALVASVLSAFDNTNAYVAILFSTHWQSSRFEQVSPTIMDLLNSTLNPQVEISEEEKDSELKDPENAKELRKKSEKRAVLQATANHLLAAIDKAWLSTSTTTAVRLNHFSPYLDIHLKAVTYGFDISNA